MRHSRSTPVSEGSAHPRRAAVLGAPIRHSLSPVLHQAAYQALGLDGWRYDAVECDEASLPGFVAGLGPEWAGLSLTMPLKRVALAVAEQVSPVAQAVGAANTLLLDTAGLRAENTDVIGLVSALREAGLERVERPVVLGAGGTAQAALAALAELGARAPVVLVRDPARTTDLRAAARRLGVSLTIRGGLPDAEIPDADVLVSTLPAGAADAMTDAMTDAVARAVTSAGSDPGTGTVVARRLAAHTTVFDVVYAPWPTPLAEAARAAGCHVVSGLAMLLYQAVAQVELMTGLPAPVAPMRAALHAAVAARQTG